jgi:uncharacterized protein (TIGR02270 family)
MAEVSVVLLQHFEQASFLWELRSRAVIASHYSLSDLAKLDQRVDAHIDGLFIAGDEAWRVCFRDSIWEEPGHVFVAAVLAFQSGKEKWIAEIMTVGATDTTLARALISALGWLSYQKAEGIIKRLLDSHSSRLRLIGISAASIHREDTGGQLNRFTVDSDPLNKARALRAVGELGRMDLAMLIRKELNANHDGCRFWAAWSIVLTVGYADALDVLESFVKSDALFSEKALPLMLRRLNLKSAYAWHSRLLNTSKPNRLTVISAGAIGDPALVPWLIEQMGFPLLARIAGETFTMITGVDLAYQDLETEMPNGFESGPNEDPNDENVEMDQDERLPWPDQELVRDWWNNHENEFQIGYRYLLGKPIGEEWMREVLRVGRQRQRAAAALELAIMRSGEPLFEVRAPGFRQQELLRQMT